MEWCFLAKCAMLWCQSLTVICLAVSLAFSDNRKSSATCIYASATHVVLWDMERSANTCEKVYFISKEWVASPLSLLFRCFLLLIYRLQAFPTTPLQFTGHWSSSACAVLSVAWTEAGLKPQHRVNKHGQQD